MCSRDLDCFNVCEVHQRDVPQLRAKITIERLLNGCDMAGAQKVLGKVEPCERTLTVFCGIMSGLEVGQGGGQPHRFIALCPVTTPFLAKGLERCGYRSAEVDKQMIFDTLMRSAHLCPCEQRQRAPFDFVDAGLNAGRHVVIRKGNQVEAAASTSTEHIFGPVPPV